MTAELKQVVGLDLHLPPVQHARSKLFKLDVAIVIEVDARHERLHLILPCTGPGLWQLGEIWAI